MTRRRRHRATTNEGAVSNGNPDHENRRLSFLRQVSGCWRLVVLVPTPTTAAAIMRGILAVLCGATIFHICTLFAAAARPGRFRAGLAIFVLAAGCLVLARAAGRGLLAILRACVHAGMLVIVRLRFRRQRHLVATRAFYFRICFVGSCRCLRGVRALRP